MAAIQKLLANSLTELQKIQNKDNSTVIKSTDLSTTHLKRLVDNNFLMPVIKGWYIISNPSVSIGDTTVWYASYYITPQKLDTIFKYILYLSVLKFKDHEKEYLSRIKIKSSY